MTPARLLAPAALVACAIALFAVLASEHSDSSSGSASSGRDTATPTATATRTPTAGGTKTPTPKTYTVQSGDTPSAIAAKEHVDLQALLKANPDADPKALTVGQKLKLP